MKIKGNRFAYLLLTIITAIIVCGCTRSPATIELAENLPQFDEDLEVSLGNIHSLFCNYDGNYRWSILMNYLTITESMINEMKSYEDEIKDEVLCVENIIMQFKQLKEKADIDQLSEEEKDILSRVEEKISEFQANRDKINSSLNAMEIYRQFVDIIRLKLIKLEEFSNKVDSINEEIESGKYDDALTDIDELRQIIGDIKDLLSLQAETGIVTIDEEAMGSWDLYLEALDELEKYINYLKIGDYHSADYHYTLYSQKYADAIKACENESLNVINSEIDSWYQDNIGVCTSLFIKYS